MREKKVCGNDEESKEEKGRVKKEEVKGYKYSLHKSILDSLNKQLFTEGGNAPPIYTQEM